MELASCPLCDAPATGTLCSCGYDFVQRDLALAIAARTTRYIAARRRLRLGLGIFAALSVSALIVGFFELGLLVLPVMGIGQLVVAYYTLGGLRAFVIARRELVAARQLKQLPTARVVRDP